MVLLMVDGNRPHIDVEQLVGCFINMIPLRFQEYCAEMNFEGLITTAARTTLQTLSHSEVAFDEIVNLLDLPRNPGYMPNRTDLNQLPDAWRRALLSHTRL